jgi:hypothetical protein
MRERTSLWMQKESGINSVAFMQETFNCKENWEFIKILSIVHYSLWPDFKQSLEALITQA